ncbi:Protein of unknown function (DUF3298) [Bernardetia litoralis DSM 6794]|uniref:DUF3298 domain-containing protein n=1 Tax=Bernardetia litoralis (strain ATCC 23117 / DSM 6794 / NBRC 15988 / NCIMB 1366 / Fx l1 / Sio-4) TaxID=880071 RepID=I4AK28_BERLS|nr:DUF3298 and DUF4163 domain-containing protein [Bernardetia litoralis]AFM04313.1 Protein of unknown function (DUF3298) [Bernardetia litoralis DSM 6794]
MREKKLINSSFLPVLFLFFVLQFLTFSLFAQNPKNNTDYCHFKGTINGNLPIIMDLIQNGDSYSGSYYYTKYNLPINLEGKVNKKGEIELFTMDNQGEKTEFITGNINQNAFVGNWKNKDKSKTLSISLVEDYSKSIAFDFISIKDSIKLFKNKKVTPQATFSDVIVEIKQVPQGSNLSKIKELLKKYQSTENKGSSQSAKQTIENHKKSFFKEYLDVNKDQDEDYLYAANWVNESSASVIFNDNYFATLSFSNYQYLGGAHGMYGENFLVIDIKNGKEIRLSDIFDKQSLATLEKKMIKKAYTYTGFEDAKSLQDAGYLVDKIEVTENFSLNAKGITFVYQPYEIAPYAAGMPEFLFTWEELKDLMKTDASVRSLMK